MSFLSGSTGHHNNGLLNFIAYLYFLFDFLITEQRLSNTNQVSDSSLWVSWWLPPSARATVKTKMCLRSGGSMKVLGSNTGPSGPWFNIKMSSNQYRKSHCGDKTILRPSYLHNGISYTGKMTSLYWIRALILKVRRPFISMSSLGAVCVRFDEFGKTHPVGWYQPPCSCFQPSGGDPGQFVWGCRYIWNCSGPGAGYRPHPCYLAEVRGN